MQPSVHSSSKDIRASSTAPLLEVNNLAVTFRTDVGSVRAVDHVGFTVHHGKTLGIVGESGSGKSVSVLAVMQLLPRNASLSGETSIRLRREDGDVVDVAKLKPNGRAIRQIRGGDIAMIFQEPMASFSPVYTIGNQIVEGIRQHQKVGKGEAREIAIEMLDRVGISSPAQRFDQYAFDLSGGMRQRAMIAVALSTRPALLIADEPTTALDVTIQAQILELLKELQADFGMSTIFITHDIGVIAQVADEIAVMYLGRVMERGDTKSVIHHPQHPYTQALLAAIPKLSNLGERLQAVGGHIPGPRDRPKGCVFHTRCSKVILGKCDVETPEEIAVGPNHQTACFLFEQ